MKFINKIRMVSVWIFIIPFVVINACLIIVTNFHGIVENFGAIQGTIPYIDGGTSISRTARFFPTYLIFKPGMIITAILLIIYWQNNYLLFKSLKIDTKHKKYFRFFGISSAILLILHSIFLGIKFDLDIYKFFRRFVILSFVIFELAAQAFLVANLIKIKNLIKSKINLTVLKIKTYLVLILIVVAIISVPLISIEGNKYIKHALEWDFFVAIISYYLLSFFLWKKKN